MYALYVLLVYVLRKDLSITASILSWYNVRMCTVGNVGKRNVSTVSNCVVSIVRTCSFYIVKMCTSVL